MPTPFYHLNVAEDLLSFPALPGNLRYRLQEHRSAFLLGNTAPDVQTVSGQAREATHFFDLPIRPGDRTAWEQFLSVYPGLGMPARLAPAQAAFLAGYLCHLQADWYWVVEIFAPVFGPWAGWQTFEHRLYLHNVLRAYLDARILVQLSPRMDVVLKRAEPRSWLPFVADVHLLQWRDWLALQLAPGAKVETVEVFAQRQGIPAENYYRLLDSEARMDEEVFTRLPRTSLQSYRTRLLAENVRLLQRYFSDQIAR